TREIPTRREIGHLSEENIGAEHCRGRVSARIGVRGEICEGRLHGNIAGHGLEGRHGRGHLWRVTLDRDLVKSRILQGASLGGADNLPWTGRSERTSRGPVQE